ncbi:MAG: hypothetical protein M1812_005389 [Candelaria pacifica]|nr:MAG: hypothetical protein M1812_005389 [Candelaria pacifica]
MGAKSDDVDIAQTVDVDYTIAFLNAIEKTCLAMARKTKFRFVYLSGLLAERDPDKSLWFLPIRRRSKGKTELSLLTFQSLHPSLFQAIILRPGRFLAKEGGFEASIMGPILGDKRSIRVDVLAAAMIDLAVKGDRDADGKEVFVNEDIVRKGRGVLEEGLKGGR